MYGGLNRKKEQIWIKLVTVGILRVKDVDENKILTRC